MKEYDRAYFDRWYHNRSTRVNERDEVRRKVALAVSMTEYVLQRPLHRVLDAGCGEGAWRSHLKALRPRVDYTGLDSSDYAVARYGKTRNIRKGTLGDLATLDLGRFDLVVCADVMHYVPDAEIRTAAAAIARLCRGVAYIEVLTNEDDVVGDLHAFLHRPAAWYRTAFRKAGLAQIGPYCWVGAEVREVTSEFELASRD